MLQFVAHIGEELRLVLARDSSWRLLSWISSKTATFSIAITAWSAKVVSSSICLAGRLYLCPRQRQHAHGNALTHQRYAEHGAISAAKL